MKIEIHKINIHGSTQVRVEIDENTVADYAEAMVSGIQFPPVVVFHDGSEYHLADGFHRVMAATRNEYVEIDAEIVPGTRQDAVWFAIGANKANGKRMERGDVKRAVEIALKEWPEKTQQAIADQVGCTRQWVGMVQDELASTCKLIPPPSRKGADGKIYPTKYADGAAKARREKADALLRVVDRITSGAKLNVQHDEIRRLVCVSCLVGMGDSTTACGVIDSEDVPTDEDVVFAAALMVSANIARMDVAGLQAVREFMVKVTGVEA